MIICVNNIMKVQYIYKRNCLGKFVTPDSMGLPAGPSGAMRRRNLNFPWISGSERILNIALA